MQSQLEQNLCFFLVFLVACKLTKNIKRTVGSCSFKEATYNIVTVFYSECLLGTMAQYSDSQVCLTVKAMSFFKPDANLLCLLPCVGA